MTKEKFQLEFPIHASISLVFEYIGTASGLSEWFADKVVEKQDEFSFTWSGNTEVAQLIRYKEEAFVRFRWQEDEDTKYFFEMMIMQDEITNDVALVVIDFAYPDELKESKLYWEAKIEDLKKIIGS